MIVKRFHDATLAQTSYLIGSADVRQAIVVDPNRDIAPHLAAAAVTVSDFVRHRNAHPRRFRLRQPRARPTRPAPRRTCRTKADPTGDTGTRTRRPSCWSDGDSFDVGRIRFDVLHTPGHTPEHLTFFVTDTATAAEPVAAISGDFVFVGDVGRPDLLERQRESSGHHGQARTIAIPEPARDCAPTRTTCRSGPDTAPARRAERHRRDASRRWVTSGASTGHFRSTTSDSLYDRCWRDNRSRRGTLRR